MKILIYSDPHICINSSIVRTREKEFSSRLESCIDSINYVESYAKENNVDLILCGGDFFDKPVLKAQEIEAVSKINFSDLEHRFIVGNHEVDNSEILSTYNSANLFNSNLISNCKVIDNIEVEYFGNNFAIVYIPFLQEVKKYNVKELIPEYRTDINYLVLSHNDICSWYLEAGLDKDAVPSNAIVINGHIHKPEVISSNFVNIGSLLGKSFSDANQLNGFILLDTDEIFNKQRKSLNDFGFIPNALALNFIQVQVTDSESLESFKQQLEVASRIFNKGKLAVSIGTVKSLQQEINNIITQNRNIVASRVYILVDTNQESLLTSTSELENKNYILMNWDKEFKSYIEDYFVQFLEKDEMRLVEEEIADIIPSVVASIERGTISC